MMRYDTAALSEAPAECPLQRNCQDRSRDKGDLYARGRRIRNLKGGPEYFPGSKGAHTLEPIK